MGLLTTEAHITQVHGHAANGWGAHRLMMEQVRVGGTCWYIMVEHVGVGY